MKPIIHISAVLVGLTCIATKQWLYLVYVVAVLFAITGWRPIWVSMQKSDVRPSNGESPASLRRWRTWLMLAAAASVLIMGEAYRRVIVDGSGIAVAIGVTVVAAGVVFVAMAAQRQCEALASVSQDDERDSRQGFRA